jgi:hypothetical protein
MTENPLLSPFLSFKFTSNAAQAATSNMGTGTAQAATTNIGTMTAAASNSTTTPASAMRAEAIAVTVLGVVFAKLINAYFFFRSRIEDGAPPNNFVVLALVQGPLVWIVWLYWQRVSGQTALGAPLKAEATDISISLHSPQPACSTSFYSKFEHYDSKAHILGFADELLAAIQKAIFRFIGKNKVQSLDVLMFFKALE